MTAWASSSQPKVRRIPSPPNPKRVTQTPVEPNVVVGIPGGCNIPLRFLRYRLGMHPLRPRLAMLSLALFAATLPAAARTEKGTDAPPQSAPKATAGVLSGQVTSVDYQRGILAVSSGGRTVDVTVLPSTSIQGKGSGYHSIAEIVRGAHVEIFTSVGADGKITAQIIRLR